MPTIYRQQWQTIFDRPDAFQQHTPAGAGYDPLGSGYPFPNGIAEGENIKVSTVGTMEASDATDRAVAGVAFYGIGESDTLRYQVPDDNTYAWDQRGCLIDVRYRHDTFDPSDFEYGLTLVLAKGLFSSSAPWWLEIYSPSAWGSGSDWLYAVRYKEHGGSHAFVNTPDPTHQPDGQWHDYRFVIQPGTITGDPLSGGFSVATDGYWRVSRDGVVIAELTDIALSLGYAVSDPYVRSPVHVRSAWLGFSGLLGPTQDFHLYRPDSNTDRSAIDCCIVAPNTPTGQGASPLLQPSIPTFLDCGGGGLVPILAPVTESEAWWGLG